MPMGGLVGQAFGVCANPFGADGHVVALGYGCGAHSSVRAVEGTGVPVTEIVVDELRAEALDVVAVEEVEAVADATGDAHPGVIDDDEVDVVDLAVDEVEAVQEVVEDADLLVEVVDGGADEADGQAADADLAVDEADDGADDEADDDDDAESADDIEDIEPDEVLA
jgi:hypothetical protein